MGLEVIIVIAKGISVLAREIVNNIVLKVQVQHSRHFKSCKRSHNVPKQTLKIKLIKKWDNLRGVQKNAVNYLVVENSGIVEKDSANVDANGEWRIKNIVAEEKETGTAGKSSTNCNLSKISGNGIIVYSGGAIVGEWNCGIGRNLFWIKIIILFGKVWFITCFRIADVNYCIWSDISKVLSERHSVGQVDESIANHIHRSEPELFAS